LVTHHDALRLRLHNHDGNWRQQIAAPTPAELHFEIDLSELDVAAQDSEMERLATAMQGNLDLEDGPLLRAALFRLGAARRDRIVLAIHHLAVDWVSWGVLLEDLDTAYRAAVENKDTDLPRKTSSFKAWAEALDEYANGQALQEEADYWSRQNWGQAGALNPDYPDGANTVGSTADITVSLDRDETRQLLQELPRAWRTQVNDVLLAGLARAVTQVTGAEATLINLEGHGREPLFDHLDISRTVGWFTTLFPVLVPAGGTSDAADSVKAVHEALKQIPNRGIGFGLLRYLNRNIDTQHLLAALPEPQIGFNYLGQIDQASSTDSVFRMTSGPRGLEQAPEDPRPHLLDIQSAVTEDRLQISVVYSTQIWKAETVTELAEAYVGELRRLIEACRSGSEIKLTPADFPLAQLEQAQLDKLLESYAPVADVYRVTSLQHGMLFHSLFTGDKDVYFARFRWRLDGPIDIDAFAAAWQETISRHDSLRSSFHWEGFKEPVQVVHRNLQVELHQEDWSMSKPAEQTKLLQEFLARDELERFDFTSAPLMRIALIRLGIDDYHFIWSFHHAIVDGWSVPLVLKEVFAIYTDRLIEMTPNLPEPKPFRDYIEWLGKQDTGAAEAYWRSALAGFSAPTPLPGAHTQQPLPGTPTDFAELTALVDAETVRSLREAGQQSRITLNTIAQGAWALLLSRYSGEDDVVFGATTSGRPAAMPGVESMIGLFLNTLPVRVGVDPELGLVDWLQQLQAEQLDMRQYEHSSLVEIQGWSDVPRGTAMFESLLAFENYPEMETMWTNTDTVYIREVEGFDRTNFPLTLNVAVFDEMHMRVTYDTRLFDTADVMRMVDHFRALLAAIADNAERAVGELPMLTIPERDQLAAWNQTERDYPQDSTLVSLIEKQVQASPDSPAVSYAGATLSYAELNARANRLARWLRARGAGAEVPVGVCLERSNELVIALLAILKSGGGYVPLDPEYPPQRLAHMLEDAGIKLLVTQTELREKLPDHEAATFLVDEQQAELEALADSNLEHVAGPDNLAYIIFTSGSTGRPKGVLNEHRGICNRLLWMQEEYQLDAGDSVLQKTPFSFDVSVWEFFWPLMTGARLVVAKPGGHRDSSYLADLIVAETITTMHFVPPMLQVFLQDVKAPECTSLKRVICSGEALPYDLQQRYFELLPGELHNLYGPTEAAIDVSYWACRRDTDDMTVPIGAPVANTQLYVVDANGQQCGIGVPGELWIGGIQVARGYINRPELSAAAFVGDPFSQTDGARAYRTGDLVRWREDGNIEFLGRIDHQIKLRGFRIELGEIENHLNEIAGVEQSVVLLREDTPGLKQLVAYVKSANPDAFNTNDAAAALAGELPDYMIPSAFVVLEEFPLTPNGKLDRKALPAPDTQVKDTEYEAPRNETEEQLAAMWAELLGVEKIGVHDDFFSLGGHSLVAMQVVSRIMQSMGVQLPLESLFDAPTIAGLAESMSKAGGAEVVPEIQRIARKKRRTRRKRDKD
jgi:amino acid adenylation domain-containing protein/non-ribosomal peptide synthase protein (TIGR01720 family)